MVCFVTSDNETTIEGEEKRGRDMSYKEEIALFDNEKDTPVEELRAMYARMEQSQSNGWDSDTDHDEYVDRYDKKLL